MSPPQPANRPSPPKRATTSAPGPQHQVVGVAEHDLDAERARSRSALRYLIAPRVPTGMKHGVRYVPRAVVATPARAAPSLAIDGERDGMHDRRG